MKTLLFALVTCVSVAGLTQCPYHVNFETTWDSSWSGDTAQFQMQNGALQLWNAEEAGVVEIHCAPFVYSAASYSADVRVSLDFDPSNFNQVQLILGLISEALPGVEQHCYLQCGENGSADALELYDGRGQLLWRSENIRLDSKPQFDVSVRLKEGHLSIEVSANGIQEIGVVPVEWAYVTSLSFRFKHSKTNAKNASIQHVEIDGECVEELELVDVQEPEPGMLLINELLFDPFPGGVDFVEVYNAHDEVLKLDSCCWVNAEDTVCLRGEYFIPPQTYRVFTVSKEQVESYYTGAPDGIWEVEKLPHWGNTTGYVGVLDRHQDRVDGFEYDEEMHHVLVSNQEGVSLERIRTDLPTHYTSNWTSAAEMHGFATPGLPNSQQMEDELEDDWLEVSSHTLSPDGDGFEDVLLLEAACPTGELTVSVFAQSGVEITRLVRGKYAGSENVRAWNGYNAQHQPLREGVYILYAACKISDRKKVKKIPIYLERGVR